MARVPYVREDTHPHLAEAITAVRAQRRGKLIPVYGLLLHSPEVATAWMQIMNAVRWHTTISGRLREIVIVRIAVLNRCRYVVDVHRTQFTEADGLLQDECDALESPDVDPSRFPPIELAVIAYVDALTLQAEVPDDVYARVAEAFDDRQMVELSVLIGAYNMHNRAMNALRIDPEPAEPSDAPAGPSTEQPA